MERFTSLRDLKGAGDDVLHAARSTSISNLHQASELADRIGSIVDCNGIAHNVTKGVGGELDSTAYRLHRSLSDLVLRQKATSPADAVMLAIVGAGRAMFLEDFVDRDERPTADAVACVLMNLAGWLCQEHGREIIDQLPAALQGDATTYLENYVGMAAARGES